MAGKRSDGPNFVSLEDALGIAQHTTNDYAKHVGFVASEVDS